MDLNATASYNGINFCFPGAGRTGWPRRCEGKRGDCILSPDTWVTAAPITAGRSVSISTILLTVGGWATTAIGGGIWEHGGVASDGTPICLLLPATHSTAGGNWMGGEAIIRLQAGPDIVDPGQPTDYWAPTNWLSLDNTDTDLGRC